MMVSRRKIWRHERGHANVGRAFGVKSRITVTGQGENPGYCDYGAGYDKCTPVQKAAMAYGGRAATGTEGWSGGHGSDQHVFNQHINQLPASKRAQGRREAKRLARKHAR